MEIGGARSISRMVATCVRTRIMSVSTLAGAMNQEHGHSTRRWSYLLPHRMFQVCRLHSVVRHFPMAPCHAHHLKKAHSIHPLISRQQRESSISALIVGLLLHVQMVAATLTVAGAYRFQRTIILVPMAGCVMHGRMMVRTISKFLCNPLLVRLPSLHRQGIHPQHRRYPSQATALV